MTQPATAHRDLVTRDFTVAVFVVEDRQVLLHLHGKLGRWLPPGGHIEPNELPDEAAIREVREETGLLVELVGARGIPSNGPDMPVQLTVPAGIQLETIAANHEHIDLVYFARPRSSPDRMAVSPDELFRWFSLDALDVIPVTSEVRDWCARAVRELSD